MKVNLFYAKSRSQICWSEFRIVLLLITKLCVFCQVTVNQLLYAATLFRNSSVVNWIVASNFSDRRVFISKVYVIFCLQWGSHEAHEFLLDMNKSWFTVCAVWVKSDCLIQVHYFIKYICKLKLFFSWFLLNTILDSEEHLKWYTSVLGFTWQQLKLLSNILRVVPCRKRPLNHIHSRYASD
jgi:hypothetical protein